MKKKLILIFPVDKSYGHFIAYSTPLSLGVIAALTPSDWDIEIIDENFDTFKYKDATLVGITSWTFYINRAYEIADIYRKKNIRVVMGGIHVTAMPDEALQHADAIVTGPAEDIWPQVIRDFLNGNLKNIYQGKPSNTFVMPRHDLFHNNYMLGSIQTGRGCPLNCDFCCVSPFNGHKFNRRPIADVLEELKTIPQKYIFFVHDNIAGYTQEDADYAMALSDAMLKQKIKKYWFAQASLNISKHENVLRSFAASGCGMLFVGIEAEDENALCAMKKQVNLKIKSENYNNAVSTIQKHGISVLAGIIFAAETDTIDAIKKRATFVIKSPFDSVQASILTPLPGTRLYDRIKYSGRLNRTNYPADWKFYNFKTLVFNPETFDITPKNTECLYKSIIGIYSIQRLLFKAVKTFIRTGSIITTLHNFSTNLSNRAYFLNHRKSTYKLRLMITRAFMGNKTKK